MFIPLLRELYIAAFAVIAVAVLALLIPWVVAALVEAVLTRVHDHRVRAGVRRRLRHWEKGQSGVLIPILMLKLLLEVNSWC